MLFTFCSVCGKNEVWNICTNPVCRRTCQNRFESNRFCPLMCVPACECKNGYIWDEVSKQCILEKQCPPYGKLNNFYLLIIICLTFFFKFVVSMKNGKTVVTNFVENRVKT